MEQGYLIIKVFTANGDLPVSDAQVFVTNEDESQLIFVAFTNSQGQCETITIDAPPQTLSQSPSDERVFTSCNVYVRKGGFFNVLIRGVQIFSGELSLQSTNLIPLPAKYGRITTRVIEITPQNL